MGERYFHMPDPDGHELSFARPIQQSLNRWMIRGEAKKTAQTTEGRSDGVLQGSD